MILIWQTTNTPPKMWLMNIHLVLASKIHHTSNKTHAKSLHFLTSIAARTKNNKAIKIFLLTSSARCRVFFVSIETVPKTHRPTVREREGWSERVRLQLIWRRLRPTLHPNIARPYLFPTCAKYQSQDQ